MSSIIHGNKIFITGGHETIEEQLILPNSNPYIYDTTIMLNIDTEKTTILPKMPSPRYKHGIILYQGQIWVVGGYDGQ